MISLKERDRRDEAHVKADMAWSKARRRSRTNGLGDMVRSIGISEATPPEVRDLRQQRHKWQVRTSTLKALEWFKKNLLWDTRTLDRSKYFPHQSDRERNRATRYQSA